MKSSGERGYERRNSERFPHYYETAYIYMGSRCECTVIDISVEGLGMRVKVPHQEGEAVTVHLSGRRFAGRIARVNGNEVGVRFESVTEAAAEDILRIRKERWEKIFF